MSPRTANPIRLDPANAREAVRDALLDEKPKAQTCLMVKPGMPYLDIHGKRSGKKATCLWPSYQVSGEYAMMRHAANAGAHGFQGMYAWKAYWPSNVPELT